MTDQHHRIRVNLEQSKDRSHDIVFASLSALPEILGSSGFQSRSAVVVTDENVDRYHGEALRTTLTNGGWQFRMIVIIPGESSKSLDSFGSVISQVLSSPIDRRTPIIAFGGGVVGDLAGFVAATVLRGVPLLQIPTSLVAQVDSSIGGKTGVNHSTGKNLIGSFYQPGLVLVDVGLLQTLPDREWMDGLSEVVKYGLIADKTFAAFLLERWSDIIARDPDTVRHIVDRCAQIKADVVSEDETERGLRAILNFGHTFGHAIEKMASYSGVTHGQGVAMGMRAAIRLSKTRHPDADLDLADQLVGLLPVAKTNLIIDDLMAAMLSDKKRVGNDLRFVLLESVGNAVVEGSISEIQVRDAWQAVLK